MPKPRAFCPVMQCLEERVVLSFSFSNLVHSLFPFIKSNDAKGGKSVRRHLPPAEVSGVKPGMPHPLQVQQAAHAAAVAKAAVVKAAAIKTAPGVVPVYGPYLGRPGSYHHIPPKIVRTVPRG
ncbi:MAG: hypothetical protein U0835_02700 [Isosphaeraceae bacterium]